MATQLLSLNSFSGGISESSKSGVPGSFYFAQNLDIYSDPSQVTLNPKTIKDSGSTVTDLIKWFKSGSPYDTNLYSVDASGNLYKRTSGGVWSVDRAGATIGNGAAGQGLDLYNDYLYYPTSTTIGRKGLLDATPTFNDDFFSDGATDLDQSSTTTGQTYTTPTSISESSTAKRGFVPTKDPVKKISVSVNTVGTGDWTVTVHDSGNTVIGSKTVANASMATGYQDFTFATPLRVINGNNYHFHVTSTVGDGVVDSGTASDLSAGAYKEYFGILIADTNWHPAIVLGSALLIGNANYIATWNQAVYNPNTLTLPYGYSVRSMAIIDEFVAIGVWKGTSITNSEEGYTFFWNGTDINYDFFIKSEEGAVNALLNHNNELLSVVGSSGVIYKLYPQMTKVNKIPFLKTANHMEVYPGAMTNWKNLAHMGTAGSTDSADIFQGVYQFGRKSDKLTEALNFGFTLSTGETNTASMKVGAVYGQGDKLFISYEKSDGTFGVDLVTQSNDPYPSGSMQFLIFDYNAPEYEKFADLIKSSNLSLNTGESIQLGYKVDRAGSYTTGSADSTAGDVTIKLSVPPGDARFHEIQLEAVLTTSVSTSPALTGVSLKFDDLIIETGTGRAGRH